jgi:putative ABC transport system permease protein
MPRAFGLSRHAIKNLKRRPARAMILVMAIGLLVSALVFGLSFVRRVESSIRKTTDRLGADLLVVPTGSRGSAEDVLIDHRVKSFYMDRALVDRVRRVRGIERVTAQTYLVTVGGACCDVPDTMVVAFDQESDFVVRPWLSRVLGRKLGHGEALVGSESALNIGLGLTDMDAVLFGNVFRMVGVLDKTGTGLDTAVFVDQGNVEDLIKKGKPRVGPNEVSVIFAKVEEGVDPQEVAGRIEDSIIEVDAVARRDVGKNVLAALGDINRIFIAFIAAASLLAASLAWAVFSGIANERTREVGILRAIGATESHVTRLFLLEVIIVGGLGSAVGVLLGTALSLVPARGFAILKNISTDLGAAERVGIAVAGLLVGTGICVVGALLPIRRTRRIEPFMVLKED